MYMKRFMRAMLLVATVIVFGSAPVHAQEMSPGMMKQGHGMGGMGHKQKKDKGGMSPRGQDTDSRAMDKKMQELHQHEKMMEGIEDQQQMTTEMKKHMQMMTGMMEEMMRQQEGATSSSGSISEHQCCKLGGMSGKPDATSGSGGMSEHQCCKLGGMSGKPDATSGSGGMSEHQ